MDEETSPTLLFLLGYFLGPHFQADDEWWEDWRKEKQFANTCDK